jgi:HAD superfamily hydrolase (TIGR01509 family)
MVTKRAVLFDVDGTLIDSNDFHAEAWQRTFAEWGHDVPFDRIRSQIGKGGDNLLPAVLPADFVAANKEAMENFRTDLFAREYMGRIEPFPEVRALFERVRDAGFAIVLASSGKQEEVAHHLKLIGAEDLVVSTTSADDAEHSKPDPDIFRSALAKLDGVAAADAVVVGDSPYDMQAAAALGIPTIGFRCGGFQDTVLMDAGCREIYDGPAELLMRFDASLLGKEALSS